MARNIRNVRDNSNPEKILLRKERREVLRDGLGVLTNEEKIMVKLRSGFNRDRRSHTFEEIKFQVRKTSDQVIKMLEQALEKLRRFFFSKRLRRSF
jgi:DNA-directed RNA polymerase sigma subunit (sigma70/sigma32)